MIWTVFLFKAFFIVLKEPQKAEDLYTDIADRDGRFASKQCGNVFCSGNPIYCIPSYFSV